MEEERRLRGRLSRRRPPAGGGPLTAALGFSRREVRVSPGLLCCAAP
uniref:Fanconi anemia core complex associated protein 20 n=1 Tax=Mus musculus TaxID=10090 RepID=F2Z421_MOUSE